MEFSSSSTTSMVSPPFLQVPSYHQETVPSNVNHQMNQPHFSQFVLPSTFVTPAMFPMHPMVRMVGFPSTYILPDLYMFPVNPMPVGTQHVPVGGFPSTPVPIPSVFPMHPLPSIFPANHIPVGNIGTQHALPVGCFPSTSVPISSTVPMFPLPADRTQGQHALPVGGYSNYGFPSNHISGNSLRLSSSDMEKEATDKHEEAHNKKMARRMDATTSDRIKAPSSSLCTPNTSDLTLRTHDGVKLKFLLRKMLQKRDVCSLGRIVLPKKEAEANLPRLTEKVGIVLAVKDVDSTETWYFRYRFWVNHDRRTYVFENTGDYIKHHKLKKRDAITIFEDEHKQLYISFIKTKKQFFPPVKESYKRQVVGPTNYTTSGNMFNELGASSLHIVAAEGPSSLNQIAMEMEENNLHVDGSSALRDCNDCDAGNFYNLPNSEEFDRWIYDDPVKVMLNNDRQKLG